MSKTSKAFIERLAAQVGVELSPERIAWHDDEKSRPLVQLYIYDPDAPIVRDHTVGLESPYGEVRVDFETDNVRVTGGIYGHTTGNNAGEMERLALVARRTSDLTNLCRHILVNLAAYGGD